MDKYANRIIAVIIEKTGVDPEDITIDSYFEDDLNISEFELFEIMDALEEEYRVEFGENEREKIVTVKNLVNLIIEKIE
jgi:acyl carrier protein